MQSPHDNPDIFLPVKDMGSVDMQFSCTGDYLLCTVRGGLAFDTRSWREHRALPVSAGYPYWCVSPTAPLLLAASPWEGTQVLEISSGRVLWAAPKPGVFGHFSPDGTIVFFRRGKTLVIVDAETGQFHYEITGPSNFFDQACFCDGGKSLVAGRGKKLGLWDVASGRQKAILPGLRKQVHYTAASPVAELVAASTGDKTVLIWETTSGQQVRTLSGFEDLPWEVDFSPDGRLLATAASDGTVRLWDPATGDLLHSSGGHERADRVRFSADGSLLVACAHDADWRSGSGHIGIWRIPSFELCATIRLEWAPESFALSPDSQVLAVASHDGLRIWQTSRFK